MKKLSLALTCIFLLSMLLTLFAYHHSITFCNVNTMHTATSFGFTEDGNARVSVSYLGYETTKQATIDIKIEKQGFLFFRTTVIEHLLFVQGEEYQEELFFPLAGNGFYYCTVTYTVSGVGEDDVIVFRDEKMYAPPYPLTDTTNTAEPPDTQTEETTSTETTSWESMTTATTTAESSSTEPPESEEEKALRLRYENAIKKMKSYQQKGSFVLNNKPLEGSDALEYLYGEFSALGDYEDSRTYLSGFAVFPDMLTKITSLTYVEGDATVSQTVGTYAYDNQGRLVMATGQEMLDRYQISAEHEHHFVYNQCGKIAYVNIIHKRDRYLMYQLWFEYGTYGDLVGIKISNKRYLTYNLYGQLIEDKEDFSYQNGRNLSTCLYSYDQKNNVTKKIHTLDHRTYGHYQLSQTVIQTYQHQYDENGYLIQTEEKKTDDFYRRYKFYGEETVEKNKTETNITYIYHNDDGGRPLTVEIKDSAFPENTNILTYHYETIYTYR